MLRGLWAGVVISLAAFLWGLYYLVRLGRELIGPEAAVNAAFLLAAYPFALFFSAPCTRSRSSCSPRSRRSITSGGGSGWPLPCGDCSSA